MAFRAPILVGVLGLLIASCGGDDGGLFSNPTSSSSASGGGSGGSGGPGGSGGAGGCCAPGCGDGVLDAGEQCDDGNTAAGDGCSPTCQLEVSPTCGDGVVDLQNGEQCDDGNNTSGDGCSAACTIEPAATCGDGVLDIANDEECDDGNTTAGDGCSPACQLEPVGAACGNGIVQGLEVCDDGNTSNGDGCNPTCNFLGSTSLFAGSPGQAGYADGVGMAARFNGAGVMTANATHLFVGEEGNRTIRSVEVATAAVVTIAGIAGPAGYVDSPIGLNARFGSVDALGTDGATLWVADGANHRIRAVSLAPPNAVITVAGSGVQGYADGIGVAAQLDSIRGLTYYNGFVYFVDGTAATLRSFNPATGEVLTLAGTPYVTGQVDGIGAAARFISPRYIANDGTGMLYIADTNGSKIRAFNTVTNEVTTFAGDGNCGYTDGVGAAAQIHRPRGMTSDGTSIYWVEFNAHTIRQGVLSTGSVSTFAGAIGHPCVTTCMCGMMGNPPPPPGGYVEGVGAAAAFNLPFSIAFHFPSNSLFVYDSGNSVIRRIQ
jgi:cysteine-rich repeat protein